MDFTKFLSTPSARRATSYGRYARKGRAISIHALREEGDPAPQLSRPTRQIFLSTPSARRATWPDGLRWHLSAISIHALREEGDPRSIMRLQVRYNFYPRPPRGGRLSTNRSPAATRVFLSTPSARRATCPRQGRQACWPISIHALREEGDRASAGGFFVFLISIHALREEGDSKNRDKISIFL